MKLNLQCFSVKYPSDIDSLYEQRLINNKKIDETQNEIDLIKKRSLKDAMV